MEYKTNQTLAQLIKQSTILAKFHAKVQNLEQIDQAVKAHLESDLARNCKVANLRNGTLILSTTSPSWNHQIRFLRFELLSKLRSNKEWCGLKAIETKVNLLPNFESYSQEQLQKTNMKKLSTDNANLIIQATKNIKSEKLINALVKLAKHTK